MSIKVSGQLSLSGISASRRKCKHTFFDQINKLINWSLVEKELRFYYPKGLRLSGKPAYSPLLLFKMLFLQTWYGLSDCMPVQVCSQIEYSRHRSIPNFFINLIAGITAYGLKEKKPSITNIDDWFTTTIIQSLGYLMFLP